MGQFSHVMNESKEPCCSHDSDTQNEKKASIYCNLKLFLEQLENCTGETWDIKTQTKEMP